jgi:hypothetical protein
VQVSPYSEFYDGNKPETAIDDRLLFRLLRPAVQITIKNSVLRI